MIADQKFIDNVLEYMKKDEYDVVLLITYSWVRGINIFVGKKELLKQINNTLEKHEITTGSEAKWKEI